MIAIKVMLRITNKSAILWVEALIFLIVSAIGVSCSTINASQPASETILVTTPENSCSDNEQDDQVKTETSCNKDSMGQATISTPIIFSNINHETRALWSYAGRNATSKRDVDKLLAQVDSARLNVILLLVYRAGTVFFEPSHTRFPDNSERLSNQSSFLEDGYNDALSYLLAVRDKRRADNDVFNDFEVHAWVNVTDAGDYDPNAEKPRPSLIEPYMLHYLHPEFKIKYGEYYLYPDERYVDHRFAVIHQPKFRAYMTDLIAGLVEDYDVDGVHLDLIRAVNICYNNEPLDYPGTVYDYPGCQEDYKSWTRASYGQEYTLWQDTDGYGNIQDGGSGRIAAWQEQAVSKQVKSIHDEVKSVRPDIIISAAVGMTSPGTRKESDQGQVAWEWLDQGWIDAAFVMSYDPATQAVINKNQEFIMAVQNPTNRSKVFPGLATYDVFGDELEWSYLVVEQVNAVMRAEWAEQPLDPRAKGVALFRDKHFNAQAINALINGPFKEPAIPFWGPISQ